MQQIRILFQKCDEAKYISHLDLTRNMQRVLKRAGIPIWYTEGFNPHPFMTFSLPLSLGMDGMQETMDVKLLDDSMDFQDISEKMNRCMPHGIKVLEVYEQQMKHTCIAFAKFTILAECEGTDGEALFREFKGYLERESIIVKKKTKSGKNKEIDLKKCIREYKLRVVGNSAKLVVILPAGCTENINPSLLIDGFQEAVVTLTAVKISRDALYNANMELFR